MASSMPFILSPLCMCVGTDNSYFIVLDPWETRFHTCQEGPKMWRSDRVEVDSVREDGGEYERVEGDGGCR